MSIVLSTHDEGVEVITLNAPETYNALTAEMLRELHFAVKQALAKEAVSTVVLTARGKGFCSGANLVGDDMLASDDGVGALIRETINPIITLLRTSPKPVIVAVNGVAAGAGVGLALAGDIVIAARTARFVLSFVNIGATLDAGTSLLVQKAIGLPRARALALLGEPLQAAEALDWGLIWKVVDEDELQAAALAVAHKLATGPNVGISLIKAGLESASLASLADVLDLEAEAQAKAFRTQDLHEGVAAFAARRKPVFKGC